MKTLFTSILVIALFLTLVVTGVLWNGFVISTVWNWFIATTFHVTTLGIVQACGISLVLRFMTLDVSAIYAQMNAQTKSNQESEDTIKNDLAATLIKTATITYIIPLIVLTTSWIISWFL
jgi:hypothetical protein